MILRSPVKQIALVFAAAALLSGPAAANPAIVIDASSGATLYQQDATHPWFPASLSKLMTVFVALKAEREGRITMNTPLLVTARAASMAPSKMGFRPGTLVTLDNALKMLMVKSANDLAITIAEGVGGSVENFADEMNASAAALGMRESHFVNPNGLPDARQVSSARDMAILARALYAYFPEHADLFDIGALKLGHKIIRTYNGMLGRYPGADGMKTGFTCSAGFNLVASATRHGRKLIAVVMGAPNATTRVMLAATLLDKGFAGEFSSGGSVQNLPTISADPPDLHGSVCRNRGKAIAEIEAEIDDMSKPVPSMFSTAARAAEGSSIYGSPATFSGTTTAMQIASMPKPEFDPLPVFVGPAPGWTGPIARPRGDRTPVAAYSADKGESADGPLKPAADAQSMHGRSGRPHKTAVKAKKPAHADAAIAPHSAPKAKKQKPGGSAAAKGKPAPAKVVAHGAAKSKAAKSN
ncbi:MAG: D-alanyl-D-alanine carboxypeptidase [Hyphomicrobiales bacterium]|nr:D-alanyl-D-alanine carboxypeptidase [Hyphomicrobiales bacterium]